MKEGELAWDCDIAVWDYRTKESSVSGLTSKYQSFTSHEAGCDGP